MIDVIIRLHKHYQHKKVYRVKKPDGITTREVLEMQLDIVSIETVNKHFEMRVFDLTFVNNLKH